jgi:hypothetical protein
MRTGHFTCDICGTNRQETRRWFGAKLQGAQLTVRPLARWDDIQDATHHVCGEGCMLALIERYMDGLEQAAA